MRKDVHRVLLDREAIAARVSALGRAIADDLEAPGEASREIVMVPILTGSIVFVADLIRHLPQRLRIGVMSVSSYPGRSIESKSALIRGSLPDDLAGRHVLIVDDILDTGQTLGLVKQIVLEHHPAQVRTCVLLRKDRKRIEEIEVDYVGFDIPDVFVVGYGLDYNDYYRNLPDLVTLRPEAMR